MHIPRLTTRFRLKRFARRHARWLILPALTAPCIDKGYADRWFWRVGVASPEIVAEMIDVTGRG